MRLRRGPDSGACRVHERYGEGRHRAPKEREATRTIAQRAVHACDQGEHDAERERAMDVRPEAEQHDDTDERRRRPGARRAEKHEERGEEGETEELRPIDRDRAREQQGGDRRQHDRERSRRAPSGSPRGQSHKTRDEDHAQEGDAAPAEGQIAEVHDDLSEPLVCGDRRAAGAPREDVRAHDAARERLAAGREMPPHVAVADRLRGREQPRERPEQ